MAHLPDLDLIFLCFFDAIAAVSFFFYLFDYSDTYYSGKVKKIDSFPGSASVIKICLYSTLIVTNWALLKPNPNFILLWNLNGLKVLGMLIGATGISIFVLAKLTLGVHYSPCFKSFVPRVVVNEKIYQFIRHPIYLGNLLIYLGAFIGVGSLWIGIAFSCMFILYTRTARVEEKILSQELPGYRAYIQKTGGFIPRLISK